MTATGAARAMTLLETVLSLGMLSMLTVSAVSWTTAAVRSSERISGQDRWERAAAQTMELIRRDLRDGDTSRRTRHQNGTPHWIEVGENSVSLPLRAAPYSGDEIAVYKFDHSRHAVVRLEEPAAGSDAAGRLLIGGLSQATFELVQVNEDIDASWILRIRLMAPEGWAARGHLPVAIEGLP